jgi:hypothetical protein
VRFSQGTGSGAGLGRVRRRFEIELTIIKQGEFELAANLGCVREIQYELSGAVPMGPTPILWQRDNIIRRIGQSAQDPAVFRRQRSAQRLGYVTVIQHLKSACCKQILMCFSQYVPF